MKRMMLGALAGAMLAGAAHAAPLPTPDYLRQAGESDLYEVESGKQMAESGNPAIRRFAQMMVSDHTESTRMVLTAAAAAGFHPMPAELTPKQLRMLADLRAARGAERDRIYLDQQREGHLAALKLQQDYALDGGIAPIKAAAARIVPIVQQHIALLDKLHP